MNFRNNYQPILNLIGAASTRGYCILCNKSYVKDKNHKCSQKRYKCMQKPPYDQRIAKLKCLTCNRAFFGNDCHTNHMRPKSFDKRNTVREGLKITPRCSKTIRMKDNGKVSHHQCGFSFCNICNDFLPVDRVCYAQPFKADKERKSNVLFLFYDFEIDKPKI